MFKRFFSLLIACVVCISFNVSAEASYLEDVKKPIRIGLEYQYNQVAYIPIANSDITIGYSVNNVFVPELTVTLRKNLGFTCSVSYLVRIEKYYVSYLEAKNASDAYVGLTTYPASVAFNKWAVYAGNFSSPADAKAYAAKFSDATTVLSPSTKRVELSDSNGIIAYFEGDFACPQISSVNSLVTLGERQYRGLVEFGRHTGKNLTPVNVISIEEYLYSVVPSEMPYDWSIEALKAQAVVSRTYAFTQKGKYADKGYDLSDGVYSQVYKGVTQEKESTTQAVNSTAGVMIYYNNVPISNATYFASSGGYTFNSEDVWTEAVPYLKRVNVIEIEPKIWTRTISLNDLNDILLSGDYKIGNAKGMQVTGRNPEGMVTELTIIGTSTSMKLTKENIRTFFSSKGGMLESRNFEVSSGTTTINRQIATQSASLIINNAVSALNILSGNGTFVNSINDRIYLSNANSISEYLAMETVASNSSNAFVLTGKGNGHGVGMSQEGARTLAVVGMSYADILKSFYTGVTVQ